MKNFSSNERKVLFFAALAFVMAIVFSVVNQYLTAMYNPKNSLGLHIVFEFLSISISYSIFTYVSRIMANTKARQELDQVIREQHGLIFKVIKKDGKFIHTLCNGDLLERLNLSNEELSDKSIFSIFPEKSEMILGYYHSAWDKGKKVTFELVVENLSLYFTLKPVFLHGQINEIIGTVADLTEQRQMEAQIRENEKLGVLGELAAGIAHEVRNPLTTLKGFLQLIKADSDHYEQSFVDLMLTEVDRIEKITDEFMSVARPHAYLFKVEKISDILEYVVKFLHPQALLKGVAVHLQSNDRIPPIICEKNQLKQVFINLIKNAFEAMPSGGNIYIKVTKQNKDFIHIQITDEGIGIPEDVIEKLGQPFFTLKEGGNGLGLMMCRKIIGAHQGMIDISSKLGVGTTFTIRLPVEVQTVDFKSDKAKEVTFAGM